ncbi:MAG: hypothetical protein LBN95_08975 [Prevotellaceae bacterium]|jgi:hypothetical protein|nr:hypothetical protein [Prevotellaceae bacterium]
MKKVFIFAAAVAIGFSACQKVELAADNNLPVKQKATANGGYSDYILSEADAIALVEKDLQNAGGEFAKKTVANIEPILFSDFEDSEKGFLELQQAEIIKLSDPALYIVSLQDGGFALVFPDKDFGVSVIHAQTTGEMSQDDVQYANIERPSKPGNPYPSDRTLAAIKQAEDFIMKLFREHTVIPTFLDITGNGYDNDKNRYIIVGKRTGSGSMPSIKYGDWETVEGGVHLVAVNNIWGTGYPLDIYAATQSTNIPINGSTSTPNIVLKSIAPTVLEFFAFFEYPNSLLGINNIDWTDIKLHTASSVAPQLAYKINQYLFSPTNLLRMECGGIFSNAVYQQYVYNASQPTHIVSANHPVIIFIDNNNTPALAYKEEVQRRECTYKHNLSTVSYYEYQSKIHYYVSSLSGYDEVFTDTSLNTFYYISY